MIFKHRTLKVTGKSLALLILKGLLWLFSWYGIAVPAAAQKNELRFSNIVQPFVADDSTRLQARYLSGKEEQIKRITYWDSLLADARSYYIPRYEYLAQQEMARICRTQNDLPRAIAYAEEALMVAEATAAKAEAIVLIKMLEGMLSVQLDRKRSLYFIYKGLNLAAELQDKKSIVDFYSSIGQYYFTSGEIDKALQVHFRCLRMSKTIGYNFGISSALVDVGSDYTATNYHEKAIPYYLESRKYLNELAGTVYAVQINNSIATAYLLQKKWDLAAYYANEALLVATKLNHKIGMASTLYGLAQINYQRGAYAAARSDALKALNLVHETNFIAQIPTLALLLRDIHLKYGNYKEALKAYELYVTTMDSFSSERIRKQAIEREYTYRLEKKENEYTLLSQQSQIQYLKLVQQRYVVAGLGSLVIVILLITYLIIRQNRFKSEHLRVQLEQKLLRAQMNPHFLFNSMNAIQQLIMSGKNKPAELYLSKFSKLIRDLLESNTKESLTVDEETGMLQAYLEMEALRFGNFSYAIDIDERIDIYQTNIPHLMIQPFVENAIWHGLLAKDKERNLQIDILYHAPQTIKCIVDDNGVGRTVSLKKKKGTTKKSLAIDFVQQRIDLIRKAYKISGSIDIIDKSDAYNKSLGTRVVLILPVLNQ